MRWLPLRKWLLDRLLDRKHIGLEIHANVFIDGWWSLTLGDRVTINRGCTLLANGSLRIGDNTMIAHDCSIITTEHGQDMLTPMRDQPTAPCPVVIGSNVWLGAKAVVLGGSVIPDGSIVGAGSLVKGRFLEPDSVIVGNPARVKRRRAPVQK